MGRWLSRLEDKKTENPPITNHQNPQNYEKGTFGGFGGRKSGINQKKKPKSGRWLSKIKNSSGGFGGRKSSIKQKIKRPKVWRLEVKTGGTISTMTVIDPERLDRDSFLKSQVAVFGKDRIISFNEK